MVAAPFDFVTAVANDRDLVVTHTGDHVCRLEPRASQLSWFCDLGDGTPTGENDPASHVRWVCPALRVRAPAGPVLEVRRSGPQSDLGRRPGTATASSDRLSCRRSGSLGRDLSWSRCRGGTARRPSTTRSGWPSTSPVD